MEYRFVHHWQYKPDEEVEAILEEAVTLASKDTGSDFLAEAAKFIAKHTGAEYVMIGLLTDNKKQIQTCKLLNVDTFLDNIIYPLHGTPCENVIIQKFCFFPENVVDNFPKDQELIDLQIKCYLGSSLLSEDYEPLGLIALMDTNCIENAAFAEHLILVLSPAIEKELTRIKASHKFRDIL